MEPDVGCGEEFLRRHRRRGWNSRLNIYVYSSDLRGSVINS